jgi:hypothetical protein
MYRILTASSDCYITDKIIRNTFRATDGNVGQAGTLDLYKLYDESSITGSSTPIEVSRLLLKFDVEPVRALTASILDLNNFRAVLHLSDVYGGQTVPTNFTVTAMPLSRSFDEGFGRDLVEFQDLDVANWVTASESSGLDTWAVTGANGIGALNDASIDVMEEGNLGAGVVSLEGTQIFTTGEEDLRIDITTILSATVVGIIPDHGLRIAFTGSQETDAKTRFVKRFYSRHSTNTRKTPKIRVTFDDTIQDDHENFFFDLSGSLFLNNNQRGLPANIVSGSGLTEISGLNSLLVTLVSGTFSQSFTASQHQMGGNNIAGVYSATFALPSNHAELITEIRNASSATFTEVWGSLDGTVPYFSGTLIINAITPTAQIRGQRRLEVSVTNTRAAYRKQDKARFTVYAFDYDAAEDFKAMRVPVEAKSIIFRDMHYQIRDFHSNDIIVPFDFVDYSTRMSTDSDGMYFDFYMDSLPPGRVYNIDVLVRERGIDQVLNDVGGRFRVET